MKARDNPFATSRVLRMRYRLQGETWDQLLARLSSLHYRAAIVGPHGSGKTTLLEDLEPHLSAQGFEIHWLRLDEQEPFFRPGLLRDLAGRVDARDVILFDGAEQLSRLVWWRFKSGVRQAGGLLVTSHRPGLLPTLLQTETSPELLAGLMGDLLGQPADSALPRATPLFARHEGNLRDALRELYDDHAAR